MHTEHILERIHSTSSLSGKQGLSLTRTHACKLCQSGTHTNKDTINNALLEPRTAKYRKHTNVATSTRTKIQQRIFLYKKNTATCRQYACRYQCCCRRCSRLRRPLQRTHSIKVLPIINTFYLSISAVADVDGCAGRYREHILSHYYL